MAADRGAIAAWLSGLAGMLVTDALDAVDLANRLSDAPALEGEAFAAEALSIMRIIAESVASPSAFDILAVPSFADTDTSAAGMVLGAFGLCVAAPRVAWASRPQARAARGRIVSLGEAALDIVSRAGGAAVDLYRYLSRLIEIAVLIVSEQAANAVPIVRVETGVSLPSSVLAYQLYGDASRAQSLVDIARSATPMIMPVAFEALES